MAGPINTGNFSSTGAAAQKTLWFPLILVTSLFFLWGFAYGLLDVLNKHFQDVLGVSKLQSTLLQVGYFGAYFLMPWPAGFIIKRYGYKVGILLGLSLYVIGALLFYPSAHFLKYYAFVISIFVIACGLSTLESAANPYITVLGPSKSAEFRLNASQSFNGVGSFLGPLIASNVFFNAASSDNLTSVQYTYIAVACVVFGIGVIFFFTKLPEINEEEKEIAEGEIAPVKTRMLQHTNFLWAVAAQFCYVGAQVGVAAFFINYVVENWPGQSNSAASLLLTYALILFTVGRFAGTALMRVFKPNVLLAIYAAISTIICIYLSVGHGEGAVVMLMILFFFESIMFATIFSLGIKDLGGHTKRASSMIISSLVGGTVFPPIMGVIADASTTRLAYLAPMVGYMVVFIFAVFGYRVPAFIRAHGASKENASDIEKGSGKANEIEDSEAWGVSQKQ